jgi:hypothetical protein
MPDDTYIDTPRPPPAEDGAERKSVDALVRRAEALRARIKSEQELEAKNRASDQAFERLTGRRK